MPYRQALSVLLLLPAPVLPQVESSVEIEFTPRTPDQMSAFYEARGFPQDMLDLLAEQCFITVRIHNKGTDTIWLDLEQWRFSSEGQPLKRFHRSHWKPLWESMGIPLARQSTFRWTLLPEQLDYQPHEQEGGNIILPRVETPIRLQAQFPSGPDRQGPVINYVNNQLRCATDSTD